MEEVLEQYELQSGVQATEQKGQDDLDMESFVGGLNLETQKVVRELLLKGTIVKERNQFRSKGRAAAVAFQESAGGSKLAQVTFSNYQISDEGQ